MMKHKIISGLAILLTLMLAGCKEHDSAVNPVITGLNCSAVVYSDTARVGTVYGATATVPYTGGNGDLYPVSGTVNSTGVTGLSATIVAGQLTKGSGTVVYAISGTPSAVGTAAFAIALGGQSCTLNLPVLPVQAAVATLSGNVSPTTAVKDTTYTGSATLSYTGGNGGAYQASTVASAGVTGLTATLAAGMLANGPGAITYTITGTPSSTGTASFDLKLGGKSVTLTIAVSAPPSKVLTLTGVISPAAAKTGTAYTGTATLNYTGGNAGIYTAGSVMSTGVTGLSASLPAGVLANGAGAVVWTISGTPSSAGDANFEFSLGGKKVMLKITVTAASP